MLHDSNLIKSTLLLFRKQMEIKHEPYFNLIKKKERANKMQGKYRCVFRTTIRICRDNGPFNSQRRCAKAHPNPFSNYTINALPLLSLSPIFADCATNQTFSSIDTPINSTDVGDQIHFQKLISARTKALRESYHAR